MEMAQAGAGQIATGIAGLGNRRLATHRAGLGYAPDYSRVQRPAVSGVAHQGIATAGRLANPCTVGRGGTHRRRGAARRLWLPCTCLTAQQPASRSVAPPPTATLRYHLPAQGLLAAGKRARRRRAAARAAASRGRRRGVTREQRAGGTQGIAPAPGQQQGRGQAGRALRNIVGSSAPSEVQWGRVSCSRHMGALRTAICQAGEGAAWNMLPSSYTYPALGYGCRSFFLPWNDC